MSSKRIIVDGRVVDEPPQPTLIAKLVAEWIGTFVLVFTACNDNTAGSQLGSISVACALMVGIYALGSVSGAHFNPAVTLGVLLDSLRSKGAFQFKDAALYWLVQLCGALCAGLSSGGVWTSTLFGPSTTVGNSTQVMAGDLLAHCVGANCGYTPLGNNIDAGAQLGYGVIFFAEVIYTCLLVFVVLNVATCDDTKGEKNYYFGLAIGFVIAAGATAIGSISGCSLNPAVSLGVAMNAAPFGADIPFVNFLYYSFCELMGAVLAYVFFAVCRGKFTKGKIGLPSKLLSEWLGTYVLVLTVCLVVSQAEAAPIMGVIGIASSLMVMIYSLAAVSGANFNPAVSTALVLTGNLPVVDYVAYVVVQILGGFAAVGTAIGLRSKIGWNVALVTNNSVAVLHQVSAANGSWGAIIGAEFFYTFLLVFVVLNVAVRDSGNQYYGLAIGFVIIAGGVAVGGLSGGAFNPAVALSLDFGSLFGTAVGNHYGFGWIYMLIELAAGATAAGVFRLVSIKTYEHDSESDDDESANA